MRTLIPVPILVPTGSFRDNKLSACGHGAHGLLPVDIGEHSPRSGTIMLPTRSRNSSPPLGLKWGNRTPNHAIRCPL